MFNGRSLDVEIVSVTNPLEKKNFAIPLIYSASDTKKEIVNSIFSFLKGAGATPAFNPIDNTFELSFSWQNSLNYSFASIFVPLYFVEDPLNNTLLVSVSCPAEYKLARRSWSLTGGVPTWDFLKDFSKVCEKNLFTRIDGLSSILKAKYSNNKEEEKRIEKQEEFNAKNKLILKEESDIAIANLSKFVLGLEDRCEIFEDEYKGYSALMSDLIRDSHMEIKKGEYHKGQLKCQFGGNAFLSDFNAAGWMVVSEQRNKINSGKTQIIYLIRKSR